MSAQIYRKVSARMYGDRKFRSLTRPQPNAQSLFLYLLTGPETCHVPGCISAGKAALAEGLGWQVEHFEECFLELESAGMVVADWEARFVWLPNAVRHNEPANPNVVKGWARTLETMPESDLRARAVQHIYEELQRIDFEKAQEKRDHKQLSEPLGKLASSLGETVSERFSERFPKQSRIQEQEQYQKQQQYQEQKQSQGLCTQPAELQTREAEPPTNPEVVFDLPEILKPKGKESVSIHLLQVEFSSLLGVSMPSKVTRRLASLAPFWRDEVDFAVEVTRAKAAKPNWGYFAEVIAGEREKPTRASGTAPGAPRKAGWLQATEEMLAASTGQPREPDDDSGFVFPPPPVDCVGM